MESTYLYSNPTAPIWQVSHHLPPTVLEILTEASTALLNWLKLPLAGGDLPGDIVASLFGNVIWKPSNFLWRKAGFHHVEFQSVYIDPISINLEMAVHEIAHVIDNSFGTNRLASIFGGGPADEMLRTLGTNPDLFLPRFRSIGYEMKLKTAGIELNPTTYGRTFGPAEDFAESFRLAVLHPELLKTAAPLRYVWFDGWRRQILQGGLIG